MRRAARVTRPDAQALYVMQNEFGLVKIGRSLDPERRRKNLQSGEGCAIAVVAVLDGQGHREEQVHLSLQRHIIEGEWFKGTPTARAAIIKALPHLAACDWPFEYDARGAKAWLDDFFGRRDRRALERMYHRILNVHVCGSGPGASADGMICLLLSLSETGDMVGVSVGREGGQTVADIHDPATGETSRAPPYSTDLASAMTLWAESTQPVVWGGTPYECAVAAMKERYVRLRSGL